MKSGGEAMPSDTMSTAPSPADHEPGAGGLIEVETCWARSSAGEHYVDIVGVAGSIPAAPTIKKPRSNWAFCLFGFGRNFGVEALGHL